MSSIDDDAINVLGINENVWKEFRHKEPVVEQQEFPEIVDAIDDEAAFKRHKDATAMRWFGYYKRCKDPQKKMKLIDQYNFLARSRQR